MVLCCSFTVTAQSQSGGKKIGNSDVTGGNFAGINLVGLTTNRTMTFRVDLEPPTHCLLQSSNTADDCPCFPIYLEQDVTTVSVLPASLLLSKCVVFTYIEKVFKTLNCFVFISISRPHMSTVSRKIERFTTRVRFEQLAVP